MNTNGHQAGRCLDLPDLQRITITLDVVADQRNEALAADALLNIVERLRQEGVDTTWLTLEISCPLSNIPTW
jgi:hypothetical protein